MPNRSRLPLGLLLLTACGSDAAVPAEAGSPVLTVVAPERGAIVEGDAVELSGRAFDLESGLARVTVADEPVEVRGEEFAVPLTLSPGLTILETIATDRAGNQARDARAVLAGTFAAVSEPVADGLFARLGPGALHLIALAVAAHLDGYSDLATLIGEGGILDVGNQCFGVEVDLRDIEKSGVSMRLSPTAGRLRAELEIRGLHVLLRARYAVGCDEDGTNVHIYADALRATGTIAMAVQPAGRLQVTLSDLAVGFDNFDFDSGDLPGDLIELAVGDIEDAAIDAIEEGLEDAVPDRVRELVGRLGGALEPITILDRTVELAVSPREVAIDEDGVSIAFDVRAAVAGDSSRSLSTPSPAPFEETRGAGVAVAVADDLVNQLLASLWASGAFTVGLAGEELRALLGADVERLELSLRLPPTLSLAPDRGALVLTIGDARVELFAAADVLLAEAAISATLELSLEVTDEGRLRLVHREPRIYAQVLPGQALAAPLADDFVAGLAGWGIAELAGRADSWLASLEVPAVVQAVMRGARLELTLGHAVVESDLGAP